MLCYALHHAAHQTIQFPTQHQVRALRTQCGSSITHARTKYTTHPNKDQECFQNAPQNVSKSHTKAQKMHPRPPLEPSQGPHQKKAHELRSGGCPKGAQVGQQKSPKGAPERPSDAHLWSKAADVSVAAFKHILKRFLLLF